MTTTTRTTTTSRPAPTTRAARNGPRYRWVLLALLLGLPLLFGLTFLAAFHFGP